MRHFLCLTALLLAATLTAGAARRALVVAVGDYPASTGWSVIHSANDVRIITPQLQRLGFEVTTLVNSQATHKAIINSLKALKRRCRLGDIVYLHFSCHGQQMKSRDKREKDGLDEAMIPWDALIKPVKGKYGEDGPNHLRDKELNEHLNKIRRAVGNTGQVVVVLDACHSGDGTKGDDEDAPADTLLGPERGTRLTFPPGLKPGVPSLTSRQQIHQRDKNQAPLYAISACQPHQTSRELRDGNSYYGSLSLCVAKALRNESAAGLDLGHLLERASEDLDRRMKRAGHLQQSYLYLEE